MKKFTILFFSLLITLTSLAQKANPGDGLLDGYFSIGTGLTAPVGNFESNSRVNPNAYAAKTSANFEMSYMARFSNYFGVTIMVRSTSVAHNVVNSAGLFNDNDANYAWSAEATPDKLKMAMAGLFTQVPLTQDKNLSLFFKPMLGASFVAQSATTYNLIARERGYSDGTVRVTSTGQSYSFAYQFALGIKYNITPLFAFMLGMDYLSTNPLFSPQAVIATGSRNIYQDITPYYLRMQMMNFNIGLALKVH
jgi:hypothetical protein